MSTHNPFDTGGYCHQTSNDPLVDKMIGNAYYVVKEVYKKLDKIDLVYNFLTTYGMVIGVRSEKELQGLPLNSKFARLYHTLPSGKRVITDYLYEDGNKTGTIPTDPLATGSWIEVYSTNESNHSGGDNGSYIPYIYHNGNAIGGENTITVPDGTVGVPFVSVNGYFNYVGYGFTYDPTTHVVTLAQKLEPGDEVLLLLTGVPAVPDNPNVSNWTLINWLYNQGAAVGGELLVELPYTFQDIPAVYINGLRLYKGLSTKSYNIDFENKRVFFTEPLNTDDRVLIQLGGQQQEVIESDRTLYEVARGFNIKDSEVILDTNHSTFLNGKLVIYAVNQQKSYKLPPIPSNVRIASVSGDQLTYTPGNVTVTLVPIVIL